MSGRSNQPWPMWPWLLISFGLWWLVFMFMDAVIYPDEPGQWFPRTLSTIIDTIKEKVR